MNRQRRRPLANLPSPKTWASAGLLLGAGLAGAVLAQPAPQRSLAPLIHQSAATTLPDQYIVVFKPGTSAHAAAAAQQSARALGAKIGFTYSAALSGFSATVPAAGLDQLRALPGVAYVEADGLVSINTSQSSAPNGLDRTSERLLPLDTKYTYSETGLGVHAYVIDTGIRTTHLEFGGRASGAFTSITDGWGTNDCHGHGTHVAGTIGAATYGIAKQVTLHAVRVLDCSGIGSWAGVIAGVDWVTANATLPAVANMSLSGSINTALNTAVTNSIAAGITYAIAAGNSNDNACNYSPASTPTAITVGNINPLNDTRNGTSNWGPCLDLFAPGTSTLSTWNTSDTATNTISGTSMASPHVAGVAARYLQTHPAASPAAVWAALHYADDVATTLGWAGIINPGPGSPNELLHYGSLNDGHDDGDPHLTTVGGIAYDFQSAGEFTMLRDGNGMEVQTRQTPVATTFTPGVNAHTGLASCVSLNTAVAARVGSHRVSYQPNTSGVPDPSGLQLRVDGVLTALPPAGLNLSGGGRLTKGPGGYGLEATFPDGSTLIAVPHWWASQSKWYLNVSAYHTPASAGVMGVLASGSWLPALPDGSSLGARPVNLHLRYVALNETFANAWRVSNTSSLFDYGAGTSTSTFTFSSWPLESPPCLIPEHDEEPVAPLDPRTAAQLCAGLTIATRRDNCVFDVVALGEPGLAKAHLISEQIERGATKIRVDADHLQTVPGAEVKLTATVAKHASERRPTIPTGWVQFSIGGRVVTDQLRLDRAGQVVWRTTSLEPGSQEITAAFQPDQGTVFLASDSAPEIVLVK